MCLFYHWQENPGSQIYGQTLTSNHHDELIKLGIVPSLKGTLMTRKFANVIFCAPPSGSPDYPGEVRYALEYIPCIKPLMVSLFRFMKEEKRVANL